ncbi:hypothetical protein THAOC_02539 [Thalassiosira oceanica]|uniref:MYND-type domain-containing protein n=1 Tax=Thalassiosira oceanica TaxID=159749 RepID=K0TLZ4_THAOC|nr:hypothetical protein THAOC_02539 [Thalassiosira oceanica]|eukprot:EJK75731.1 hypothetical protein THAOC_02539 [Thalassiosira oceanica]
MKCSPCEETCANCGGRGSDSLKLKDCTACRLVKYCGVECQKVHRKQHKTICKQRAAEIKDEQLYSQGHERPEGDFCPICTLAIPFPMDRYSCFSPCCINWICHGCGLAAQNRGMLDCPFCRTTYPNNHADTMAMLQVRVEKKDPEAISTLGETLFQEKDERRAVKMWAEAADLGSITALANLGVSYYTGNGVQEDKVKGIRLYEKAAMQGSAISRRNLGHSEASKGNHGRALKHFLISAKMGDEDSVEMIKEMFMAGVATKEKYAEALKSYQNALEEMQSSQRDEANRLMSTRNL